MYFNYKGSFSIVLLAVVDARYLFQMVDVGAYGKSSDGGTLCASNFGKALHQGTLDLPNDAALPGAEDLQPVPHVFVGDEAFPLKRHLLRPYPGKHLDREKRIFNYRLSRARRMVHIRDPCCPMETLPQSGGCLTKSARCSGEAHLHPSQFPTV
ncbi:protein ALP1-like [Megalobrama amblycephala]|uniref:protein ALP1-like n=1 Tax=Megalobrama amblycephala TaxID=75352 RepID=UPI0020143D1E|nr:protein ALP1-like [Megalobrama amblycephala]